MDLMMLVRTLAIKKLITKPKTTNKMQHFYKSTDRAAVDYQKKNSYCHKELPQIPQPSKTAYSTRFLLSQCAMHLPPKIVAVTPSGGSKIGIITPISLSLLFFNLLFQNQQFQAAMKTITAIERNLKQEP
ncbi:hypothetical protein M0R45_030523 [Rubus argutus]|uniref:Uncharacterized protein n=1 Tax=Rubus argutus TaxID=59490 RepID=A0AAW1WAZ6_RUBAR